MDRRSFKDGPSLQVFPAVVEFRNIELDVMYIMTLTIQNISCNALRYRLSPPLSKCFKIVDSPTRIIAPGMSVKVEVKFVAKSLEADQTDNLILTSNGTKIDIPLRAYVPSSQIEFNGFADLGPVVLENRSATFIDLVNTGVKDGTFRIDYDQDSLPLTITPSSGMIPCCPTSGSALAESPNRPKDSNASNVQKLKIEFTGSKLGIFRCIAKVSLSGQSDRIIDIHANVVEHRLEIVLPDGGGQISSVPFGSLYYGQERTILAILVNNGPNSAAYQATLNIDDSKSKTDSHSDILEDASANTPAPKPDLTVTPYEGVIAPYAQTTFTFHYKPKKPRMPTGFATTSNFDWSPVPLKAQLQIESSGIQQQLQVDISGQAVYPQIEVSQRSFDFGKCAFGDRVDMLVTIKNAGVLPATFALNQVAHFRCRPSKGKLESMQSLTAVMSFVPAQLGAFHNTLHLVVGKDNLQKIMIKCRGEAQGISPDRKTSKTGTKVLKSKVNATPEDFRPEFHFQRPEEIEKSKSEIKSTYTRVPAWKKALDEGGMRILDPQIFASGNEARLTFCLPEIQRREEHRKEYNDFIKQSRVRREQHTKAKRTLQLGSNPANLGLEPQSDMEGPIPDLPPRTDKLWLRSEASGGNMNNRVKHDENRLIKKKFKPSPITQAERQDCTTELTIEDLNCISCGPKHIEFGRVCVHSTNWKSFGVVNDLPYAILVELILTNAQEEMADATPMSQVIPAGATTGFDICFFSPLQQDFQQSFNYRINGHHTYNITVAAEVVPISVELSQDLVEFQFPESSTETYLTKTFIVKNTGNSVANFQAQCEITTSGEDSSSKAKKMSAPVSAFTLLPDHGSIKPGQEFPIEIKYQPFYGAKNQSAFHLIIEGGVPSTFHCFAPSQEPKTFRIREKKIDFETVAVGLEHRRSFHLTNSNSAKYPVVFHIEPLPSKYGLEISPMSGVIAPNSEVRVHCRMHLHQPLVIENLPLRIHLREGKDVTLSLSANVILPDLKLLQSELNYGGITLGVSRSLPVQLHNRGPIPAIVDLDLSPYAADFQIHLPAQNHDDNHLAKPVEERVKFEPLTDESPRDSSPEDEATEQFNHWRITCPSGHDIHFQLECCPSQVSSLDFKLPLQFVGIEKDDEHDGESIQPQILAQGVPPRLLFSQTSVDFGNRVIPAENDRKVPTCVDLTLTNDDPEKKLLSWEIDLEGSLTRNRACRSVVHVAPTCGELEPGESSTVRLTFMPTKELVYALDLAVYLDHDRSSEYLTLDVQGQGIYPHLTFSQPELVLPLVPLLVTSTLEFQIQNVGYDNMELNYRIPVDLTRVPLEVVFPQGQMIGLATPRLDVQVLFCSKKPVNFTTKIEFYDTKGNIFSIPISGTTENCGLTNTGFILQCGRSFDFFTLPVASASTISSSIKALKENVVAPSIVPTVYYLPQHQIQSFEKQLEQGKTIAPSSISALSPMSTTEDENDEDIAREGSSFNSDSGPSESAKSFLYEWIYKNFAVSIHVLPEDGTTSHGKFIYDILDAFGLKAPPGRLSAKVLQSASKKKHALLETQYMDLLRYFKSYGGMFHGIKPEHYLSLEDYVLAKESQENTGGGAKELSTRERMTRKAALEREWQDTSEIAWITLLYQFIKCFVLFRINLKSFEALPGIAPGSCTETATQGMKKKKGSRGLASASPSRSKHQAGTTSTNSNSNAVLDAVHISKFEQSNVYSVSEHILLQWITVHVQALTKGTSTRAVENFSTHLRDGVALYAVIVAHLPSLAQPGGPLENFQFRRTKPLDSEQVVTELTKVISVCKTLQIDLGFHSPQEYQQLGEREMCLLYLFLYQRMPQYIPKTNITFEGNLGAKIQKKIELTNPTKHTVAYHVSLEGSNEFILHETEMVLDPQETKPYIVDFHPRFTRSVEARLTFQESGASGGILVFALTSNIRSRTSIRTFTCASPTYEPISIDLDLVNQFPFDGRFTLSLVQDSSSATDASSSTPVTRGLPVSYADYVTNHHEAFHCKAVKVTMKAGGSASVNLSFLPLLPGEYHAQLLCRDEQVGEFMYDIVGQASLPESLVLSLRSDLKAQISPTLAIPFRHAAFLQAVTQATERLSSVRRNQIRQALVKSNENPPPQSYSVELHSPYYSSRQHQVLCDPSCEKDTDALPTVSLSESKHPSGNGRLALVLEPKDSGTYPCTIVLRSPTDIRRIEITTTVLSVNVRTSLEFVVPARERIVQDIPMVNNTSTPWTLRGSIAGAAGNSSFSGPGSLSVAAKSTAVYALTFAPAWIGNETATLTLSNAATGESFDYDLSGVGEEPLAIETIKLMTKARAGLEHTLQVPRIESGKSGKKGSNSKSSGVEVYSVESDLPCISGASELRIEAGVSSGVYGFHFDPLESGVYEGSLTLKSSTGEYCWFAIEAQVESPEPESVLDISAVVREAVAVEIALKNPLVDELITFDIELRGPGLSGDSNLMLEAGASATYAFVYSPLVHHCEEGERDLGAIVFRHPAVGEFWYQLRCHAQEAPILIGADMTCTLGSSVSQPLQLTNPTGHTLALDVTLDNKRNFSLRETSLPIQLPPFATVPVMLDYRPSSLTATENVEVIFQGPGVSDWIFHVSGSGTKPEQMHPVTIQALLGQTTSTLLTFHNPFSTELYIEVGLAPTHELSNEVPKEFQLMMKKEKLTLEGFASCPISLSFSPVHIATCACHVVISTDAPDLRWVYPLVGIAEAPPVHKVLQIKCQARESLEQLVTLHLEGLDLDEEPDGRAKFSLELDIPPEMRKTISRALQVTPVNVQCGGEEDTRNDHHQVEYRVRFDPLRPVQCKMDLVVTKCQTGGQWRFPLALEALEPEVDDTIVIESTINQTSSVSFRLANHFRERASFQCEFTLTSSPAFTVFPLTGELAAYGEEPGTNFILSFTPLEYGQVLTARLTIITEEVQWTFDIQGTHPKYVVPRRESMIDQRLSADVVTKLAQSRKKARAARTSRRLIHNQIK